jgi:hypothetical protein
LNTNNWKQVLGESILIPRRSQEERQKTRLDSIKRLLRQTHIDGDLDLQNIPITNLGNLESIDGYLDLRNTPITNLGNLTSVGRSLYLRNTPISKMNKLQRQEILKNVKVKGRIIYEY